jgi:hypothetical protein
MTMEGMNPAGPHIIGNQYPTDLYAIRNNM